MASDSMLSTPDLMAEIGLENYITDPGEFKEIRNNCTEVINAQQATAPEKAKQIKAALEFTRSVWKKYDCEDIAELYAKFQRIEEGLFGLERDEAIGSRYREHFVHMFNCYIFGLRFLTSLSQTLSENDFKRALKVKDERLKEVGLPFGQNYSHKKRLFYLWTLISTFHDIAIPFQHLKNLGSGINKFVQEFGWEFTEPYVSIRPYDSSILHNYFELLGGLYGGGLVLFDSGRKYKRPSGSHQYISRILGREFDRGNHGVLSGFFMWRIIEEIFLVSRTSKYRLTMDEFNKYDEYVLKQDIARAALAISFHSLKSDKRTGFIPRMFPIMFSKMPLTFLLILSDELQEYLRWEGVTVENAVRFKTHPRLEVTTAKGGQKLHIRAKVTLSWDSKDEADAVSQANAILRYNNAPDLVNDLSGAADVVGNSIKGNLENRLLLGADFELCLAIKENWSRGLYAKDLKTPAPLAK